METQRAIGRILKAHRTLAGLSQVEAAARAGISPGTLSLAESGHRPLSAATTIRVLTVLAEHTGKAA